MAKKAGWLRRFPPVGGFLLVGISGNGMRVLNEKTDDVMRMNTSDLCFCLMFRKF